MIVSGVVVYSTLYWLWVPTAMHEWPLYFDFPTHEVVGLAARPATHVRQQRGYSAAARVYKCTLHAILFVYQR